MFAQHLQICHSVIYGERMFRGVTVKQKIDTGKPPQISIGLRVGKAVSLGKGTYASYDVLNLVEYEPVQTIPVSGSFHLSHLLVRKDKTIFPIRQIFKRGIIAGS